MRKIIVLRFVGKAKGFRKSDIPYLHLCEIPYFVALYKTK